MLINNVASTAVVMMVVLKAVLTMTMIMTTIMMGTNLFFFNLYAVVAMNIVAWVTNSLNAR